jgi:hypothetical protein
MPTLAMKNKRRYLAAGALTAALAAGWQVLGTKPTAQAFDCYNTNPRPLACPYVKVRRAIDRNSNAWQDLDFAVTGQIVDPSGNVIHEWSELNPDFTLWRWRYYGDKSNIKLTVTQDKRKPKYFEFPASKSSCYMTTEIGVREVTGCDDHEDPPK